MEAVARDPNDRSAGPQERPNGIYCSSWCGAGCKRAAYDRAMLEAGVLVERMGPGWTPVVTENMGWHFGAKKGKVRISPDRKGSSIDGTYAVVGYTAIFNNSVKSFVQSASTPEQALRRVIEDAEDDIRMLRDDLAAIL